MRTIKFRAFDVFKRMFNVELLDLDLNTECRTVEGRTADGEACHVDWNEAVLMQFTGFTDRSNNDIYDGDLCRCYAKDGSPMINEVKMVEGVWTWGGNPDDRLSQWLRDNDMEIIGNVYELDDWEIGNIPPGSWSKGE